MTAKRIAEFQARMREKKIDAAMIKTASSFAYFTDVMWLRPGLVIPAEGEPVAFIVQSEVEAFRERSCIKNIVPYHGIDELMPGVTKVIRDGGHRIVGMDMSVERDAYELFGHMFARVNPKVQVVDVHSLIMESRMIKDSDEIARIRRAAQVTDKGMETAMAHVCRGVTELDVAAEAVYAMMKQGAERPHVYVNAGPVARIHAEPRVGTRIGDGDVVSVTIGGDWSNYYANETRTYVPPTATEDKRRAFDALRELHDSVTTKLTVGTMLESLEKEIEAYWARHGHSEHYVKGFAHGVGLLIEEDPITTILIPERRTVLRENMVIAAMHAPLAVPGAGSFKNEDTFLLTAHGPERLTHHPFAAA